MCVCVCELAFILLCARINHDLCVDAAAETKLSAIQDAGRRADLHRLDAGRKRADRFLSVQQLHGTTCTLCLRGGGVFHASHAVVWL